MPTFSANGSGAPKSRLQQSLEALTGTHWQSDFEFPNEWMIRVRQDNHWRVFAAVSPKEHDQASHDSEVLWAFAIWQLRRHNKLPDAAAALWPTALRLLKQVLPETVSDEPCEY